MNMILLEATPAVTNSVAGIFEFIGTLFSSLVTAAGNFITAVFAEPIFAIAFLLPLVGIGISFARKLLSSTHA